MASGTVKLHAASRYDEEQATAARVILARPETYGPGMVQWAERFLAGFRERREQARVTLFDLEGDA